MLTRWQPLLDNFNRMQDEMSRALGAVGWNGPDWRALSVAYPQLNVWEDAENVYAEAELPGMTQEDLQIYVAEENQLSIVGARKPAAQANCVWHRQERGFGKFQRSVTLPAAVDAEKVEAKLENGVLTLKLPKAPEAKPRRIAIKAE